MLDASTCTPPPPTCANPHAMAWDNGHNLSGIMLCHHLIYLLLEQLQKRYPLKKILLKFVYACFYI